MSFSRDKRSEKSTDESKNTAEEVSQRGVLCRTFPIPPSMAKEMEEREKKEKESKNRGALCRVFFTGPKKEEKEEEQKIEIFSMEEFIKKINSKDPNNTHEILERNDSLGETFCHFLVPYFRTTLQELVINKSFEKSIIKHAKFLNHSVCSEIDADRDITRRNARFSVTKNGLLVINYLSLTQQQIAEICAVYKSFYGEHIILLAVDEEARLGKGYGFMIYFDPCEFLKEVLPNLNTDIRPTKKEDVLPANIKVYCAQLAYQSVRLFKKPTSNVTVDKAVEVTATVEKKEDAGITVKEEKPSTGTEKTAETETKPNPSLRCG